MSRTGPSSVSSSESEALARRIDFRKVAGREILVTGASGMVGSFLTASLISCCRVQGLVTPKITILARSARASILTQFLQDDCVSVVETALSNWQLDKSYDILIHAASPASPTKYGDARSVLEANVGFLENLADQKMPETTLFVSSGEVYGAEPPEGVLETQKVEAILNGPRAVYPQAKIAAENLLIDLGGQGITNPLIARLFHSFGPGLRDDDGRSFGDFLWSAARRRDISMLSPGDAVRTFLYLEDAVAGLLAVLTEGLSGETYNVGSELPVTILEFANSVAQVSGVEVTRATDLDIAKRAYVSSPIASIIPSTKKLRDLGWSQEVALTEGIARSIDWLRRQLT